MHTSEYAHFLEAYLGPFQHILQQVPVANQDSPGHKLRNMVLEILNRYTHSLSGVKPPCPVQQRLSQSALYANVIGCSLWAQ